MKILLLLIFFVLLINNIYSLNQAKEFLTEFIKTASKGKVIENLSEDCLGKYFDYQYLLLKKNYKENNFEKISKSIENIVIDIFINCPNYELISIFNDTNLDLEKVFSLPITTIYKKVFFLSTKIYMSYFNATITGASLGRLFGEIINIFKENLSDVNVLEPEKNSSDKDSILDNINQYFDIIGGIFNGMKEKEDGSESKCYNDILKGKNKIMNHIKEGFKNMDKDKEIGQMISTILFNLITVEGLVVDCNLLSFGSKIISKLTSTKDMTELFNSIIQNSKLYISYITKMADSFRNNNMKDVGKYIGKTLSSIFDFHVK